MPIYEYRCENDHTFEVRQSFSEDPVRVCEVCGAPVQRVFHPVAVHFKGSGFYNTDYGTRKRAREQKESKESSAGESKSGSEKGGGASDSSSSSSKAGSSGSSGSGSSDASGGGKSGGGSAKPAAA